MATSALAVLAGVVGAVGSSIVGACVVLGTSLLLRRIGREDAVAGTLLPVFTVIKAAVWSQSWIVLVAAALCAWALSLPRGRQTSS